MSICNIVPSGKESMSVTEYIPECKDIIITVNKKPNHSAKSIK